MNIPAEYYLDALDQVLTWDLPDDEIAAAANAQAYLMSGGCTGYYEDNCQEPDGIFLSNY